MHFMYSTKYIYISVQWFQLAVEIGTSERSALIL